VAEEFAHEGVAETPDLAVGLALGVEVGSSFSSSHAETGQRVLESLLEAEELEDGQVDGGVEAETALVGTESRVVLWARRVSPAKLFSVLVDIPAHGIHG
jgi:hypothetical protein